MSTIAASTQPVEARARCRDCRKRFVVDASYWASRGWALPKRCQSCRLERRAWAARLRELRAVVAVARPSYVIARTDAGAGVFLAAARLEPPPRLGEVLYVTIDPDETPPHGRSRRAVRVRRLP